MSRNAIPMAIAGFSTFIHACMIFFLTYAVIQLAVVMAEPVEDDYEDSSSALAIVGGFVITILVISLLLEIAVLIVSIYLILGIKRERHQYIAPWVYLTAVYTILSFIGVIKSINAVDASFAIKVIIIIIHAGMWYPIYKYWRDLKTRRNPNLPENSPLNVCFSTQTPGMVYNAGPVNWQQGQSGATYYPPPGYGPQMQMAPQNYTDGQMQPTANAQLASASYPRQMMATTAEEAEAEKPPSYAKVNN